ncbi:MAG: hypothetical protein LBR11_10305 [Deltaproteobacteria bacterium]|jgi:hypothetical protein|nr:hypothetical protein [Deltaproteobacteria bacterium]
MPILFIIGLIIVAGGLVLFVSWFDFFWILIKALAPLAIITLGGVLTYFGWEERKDRKGAILDFSSPAEASRYQAEALAYQERLNNLQEEENKPEGDLSPDKPTTPPEKTEGESTEN